MDAVYLVTLMEPLTTESGQLGRLRDLPWLVEYTGLSKDTIYELVKQNRIPVTRIDRRLRFDIVAIDKWIARQTTTPGRVA